MLALTRPLSPAIARCELTHMQRAAIDFDRAAEQHAAYCAAFQRHGIRTETVEAAPSHADSVFIEDCAVVVDELAVLTRPGAVSRRGEVEGVRRALESHRSLVEMTEPATLDGGDVLRMGREVFVGIGSRTNRQGLEFLRRQLFPWGYRIHAVELGRALHLKTAVTALDDRTLLLNPDWVDAEVFHGYECVTVDPLEPFAGNVLRLPDVIVVPLAFPRTAAKIVDRGFEIDAIDASELAKAEGGLTCCSILLEEGSRNV